MKTKPITGQCLNKAALCSNQPSEKKIFSPFFYGQKASDSRTPDLGLRGCARCRSILARQVSRPSRKYRGNERKGEKGTDGSLQGRPERTSEVKGNQNTGGKKSKQKELLNTKQKYSECKKKTAVGTPSFQKISKRSTTCRGCNLHYFFQSVNNPCCDWTGAVALNCSNTVSVQRV